jgi:hypothetical protein
MASSREEPPLETWLLGVSRTLLEPNWNWPVHGLRHPPAGDTSGWYIWVGELTDDADFFVPQHARHLIERVPELRAHLTGPPGSRFLIAPGYVDRWQDDSLLDVGEL